MRYKSLGVLALGVGLILPATAFAAGEADAIPLPQTIAAMCVQGQLDAAGYELGSVDGKIGPKSQAAAAQYASDAGTDELGELTMENAEQWCRALAVEDDELASFLASAIADARAAQAYGPAGDFRYNIADNVPAEEIDLIKTGLGMADRFMEAELGGGLTEAERRDITVKIVATGVGNQEPGGGGGGATAFSDAKARPFFDVAHPQWNQDSSWRGWTTRADSMKTVAHEYTHIWQGSLGAISGIYQPLPGWINEGLAEYLGYVVMEDAGEMDWDDIRPFVLQGALNDQLDVPLNEVDTWAGHVGLIAIDWLVASSPNGLMSLRILGDEVGKGRSSAQAFRTAFGLEMEEFYRQFEVWRAMILADSAQAFAVRPELVLAGS